MRYIQLHASGEHRVVAGSWALHRLLSGENAEVTWLPGDLDVLVRGRGEAKLAIEQTMAYWSRLGYTVETAAPEERNSYTQYEVIPSGHLLADRPAFLSVLPTGYDATVLQGCMRRWLDVHRADPAYAPLLHQLDLAAEHLPAKPDECGWLVEAIGAVERVMTVDDVTAKIVVTSPNAHKTTHKINIISYVKVLPSMRPTDAERAMAERAPIESVVDSFDMVQCAVWCRMNADLNSYRFGGAGEAVIKSGLRLGPIPPLVLAPCVFAKATNLCDACFGGPWRPATDVLGDQPVPILYDRSCMEALINFQMQRIVKYLRRGFRFPARTRGNCD